MKNDRFFNGIAIVVPLLLAIGMFKHGLPYFWAPYLFSLLCLCRYTDYLETNEKDEYLESVKYDNVLDDEVKEVDDLLLNEQFHSYHKADCNECGYVICVCRPVVNQ